MTKLLVKFILAVVALLLYFTGYAQVSLYTAGEFVRTPQGELTYSVGQVMFIEASGSEGGSSSDNLTKPYEYHTTRIDKGLRVHLNFRIYPNPARDILNLERDKNAPGLVTYSLVDIAGRVVRSGQINDQTKQLNIGDLAPACYLLQLSGGGEFVSYRLMKL